MKRVRMLTCFIFCTGFIFIACTKNGVSDDEKQAVSLYSCIEKVNGLPGTRICLDSVVAEARCPENVQCFWQGYTIVKVSFQENGNTHSFRMSLWATPLVEQQFNAVHDTTINGYKVVFNELSATQKPPSEVKAVFDISR